MGQHVDRVVAPAALGRAVLLARAAATLTAGAVGLRLVADPRPLLAALAVVAGTTLAGLAVLSRHPHVARHPVPVLAADTAAVLGVLALDGGGVTFYCCAVGASALAGVLAGMWALPLAAAHTALGYLVAAAVLPAGADPRLAGFVLTFPIACVLAAAGAAVATAALGRYVELSVRVVASAQRTAAASERARLARELHDSVTKTLRGVSFAALALPQSLRRHPDLAEQLADTVSRGASVAAEEARELVDGLRLDAPDSDFADTVQEICRRWSQVYGIPVRLATAPVDPPVAVRYELCRILQEALHNVAQHASARHVGVAVRGAPGRLELRIRDDGRGFGLPADLSQLRAAQHFGLIGMYERAHTIDGSLHVASSPGRGTTVEVTVPA
ncbi:sensor histidine kinase [Dactylosporangium siamense]|uniref:sensor histidine kinase n=1 Tax=Dactylosporangium siamense TaxID=685454 RepID=UPI0019459126|nr:histidine kinase [Dactylosporangium siamense]